MNEVFDRTMFLQMANYNNNHKECLIQAVRELVSDKELQDTYNINGITYDEYIEDMANAYLRYKSQKVREWWQKSTTN